VGTAAGFPDEELSSEALLDALAIYITAKPKIGECLKTASQFILIKMV